MDEHRWKLIVVSGVEYIVADAIKEDLDPAGYDRLINFMESPRYQLLQQQFTRETVEHLLVRMGFRMYGPDAYNELQEQMAFLRRMVAMKPSLEDRVQTLESRLDASEQVQAARFAQIIESLNEKHLDNKQVNMESAKERAAIKTEVDQVKKDVQSTKNTALLQLVIVLIGVVGVLVTRYVLP